MPRENEKHVTVLSEIFNAGPADRDWSLDEMLAFGAAIRALSHDDEFLEVNEQLEHYRALISREGKSSSEYARLVGELEVLQRKLLRTLHAPSGELSAEELAKLKGGS